MVTLIPGDGIGPELAASVKEVFRYLPVYAAYTCMVGYVCVYIFLIMYVCVHVCLGGVCGHV